MDGTNNMDFRPMPRDGAIIFGDLIGKLGVLTPAIRWRHWVLRCAPGISV
jgi:hypothetical protein